MVGGTSLPGGGWGAKRSEDGKSLLLQVVNLSDKYAPARIIVSGFIATKEMAEVTELAGPLEAANTANKPDTITPRKAQWRQGPKDSPANYVFPAHSVTLLRFN